MLIAVPSETPGGLDAPISEHFGHCAAFTLVRVDNNEVGNVEVLENSGHVQGGCMTPVMLLKEQAVDVLVAGGMGGRPLAGFQQVGIKVHFKEDASSVKEAVDLFLAGKCREFGEAETCGGGGGACGGHQHEVEREPIEGPHDVRDGRVVTLDFELKDPQGNLIESSRTGGPMRYLHGSDMILPALEKAFDGLEEGAQTVVELSSADAFGEREESRILEVPRHQLPPDITVGALVSGTDPSGQRIGLTVIELDDEVARVDANHPLAGKDLVFEVTIVKVESATPEELAHGHVH
jgi:FKBP-type peptidyl-prolyl cis-trans isomerase 2/predicted Fe-Mo cluster-binding NifX family protein